jgi:sec-independent protein translocase protein TatC
MSVVGHLEELRKRIFYVLIALLLGTIISFVFIKQIILFLKAPIADLNIKLYYFKPYEKLTTYFKIALFAGLIISVPFSLYQVTRFILPALYNKERRFYFGILPLIFVLFLGGAFFCYKIIAPISFKFFTTFMQGDDVIPLWGIKDYFSLLMLLVFFTGVIFQLPLVMMLLARIGIVTGKALAKYRKHAIVIIFILSAVITPPDVVSQILLAIPTVLLYEISIFLAKTMSKKREKEMQEILREEQAPNDVYNDDNTKDTYDYNPYDSKKL